MDDTEKRFMQNLCLQIHKQSVSIANMEQAIKGLQVKNGGVFQTIPFGVVDITTAQLVDAYHRGLNLDELITLANGKYTGEQIVSKIKKSITGGKR